MPGQADQLLVQPKVFAGSAKSTDGTVDVGAKHSTDQRISAAAAAVCMCGVAHITFLSAASVSEWRQVAAVAGFGSMGAVPTLILGVTCDAFGCVLSLTVWRDAVVMGCLRKLLVGVFHEP